MQISLVEALKIHVRMTRKSLNLHKKRQTQTTIGQRSDAKSLIKLKCQRFRDFRSDSKSRRKKLKIN